MNIVSEIYSHNLLLINFILNKILLVWIWHKKITELSLFRRILIDEDLTTNYRKSNTNNTIKTDDARIM